MKKYKTKDLEVFISVRCIDDAATFHIEMTGEPINSCNPGHQHHIQIPQGICKSQFNDANFIKHILNFFIKD